MDDLKVYEADHEEMESTLEMVESAAHAVGMELGAQKCEVAHIKRGRVTERGGIATRLNQIKELTQTESYRCVAEGTLSMIVYCTHPPQVPRGGAAAGALHVQDEADSENRVLPPSEEHLEQAGECGE